MELTELFKLLKEHNEKGGQYQIHLNSADLEDDSKRYCGVEFTDIYFSNCQTLENVQVLAFDNANAKPLFTKDDGTEVYSMGTNSSLFIDIQKIESIEKVEDNDTDWFTFPSSMIVHLHMLPDGNGKNRNVVTVGFMK